MTAFFFDTSAIVKRYFPETGTTWVQSLTDPSAGHIVVLAEITLVEVAAASAAKHRASGGITRPERDKTVNLFLHHCTAQYVLISPSRAIVDRAVHLTQVYRLRGYDALQLATALVGNDQAVMAGLPVFILLSADNNLLIAARAEGLIVDNPSLHP